MANAAWHSWAFKAGMRARSFGWRGSRKAIARLKAAVSEIEAVRKRDRVAAGEGVVSLAERIWPAFEQIDTSSGVLGNAVNRTLESLIPILIAAPADEAYRIDGPGRYKTMTLGAHEFRQAGFVAPPKRWFVGIGEPGAAPSQCRPCETAA